MVTMESAQVNLQEEATPLPTSHLGQHHHFDFSMSQKETGNQELAIKFQEVREEEFL
jgi:hypothetical protein